MVALSHNLARPLAVLLATGFLSFPLPAQEVRPVPAGEPEEPDYFFLTGGPYTQKKNSPQIIWANQWFWSSGSGVRTRDYTGGGRFEWGLTDYLETDFEFGALTSRGRFVPFTVAIDLQGPSKPEQRPAAPVRQVPELITDRPDLTESSSTVPAGYVQIETGWIFTREDEEGVRQQVHELPGTLVRIGLVDWLELRTAWGGYIREDVRVGPLQMEAQGVGDAELGTKIRLLHEKGALPEVAFLVAGSLPVGSNAFSADRVDPSFRFSLSHTLSDRVGLGYNLGMVWESKVGETGKRTTLSNYLYTLALGVGLTEQLGAFVEVFGDISASATGKPAHSFDGGFTYLLRNNLQLDVAAGVGLSKEAPDWFVGVGVSVLLPE